VAFSTTRSSSRGSQHAARGRGCGPPGSGTPAQPEGALEVPPAAFALGQLLVGGGEVLRGEGEVGGGQQPLARPGAPPASRRPRGCAATGRGEPQVAAQPRLGSSPAGCAETPPTRKRGAPHAGDRLPKPEQLAAQARLTDWRRVGVDVHVHAGAAAVCRRDLLGYAINKRDLLRLVIVRDPAGVEPEDSYVTTTAPPTGRGRFPLHRPLVDRGLLPRCKQDLGGQDAQSWQRHGPESAACLPLWPHACVGSGTSTLTPPAAPGLRGAGTPARPAPTSWMRWPRCAACCGPNDLSAVIVGGTAYGNHRGAAGRACLRGMTQRHSAKAVRECTR
jgi:hypothetical protein